MSLAVPAFPTDVELAALGVAPDEPRLDTLAAALAYAGHGWYVLPADPATKNPGSIVGRGWPAQSSRDPQQLAAWFAGTNAALCLHAGRSGAVILDVDNPAALPVALFEEITRANPPYQSTRLHEPVRGHYVFAMPPGRNINNSGGKLGTGWGEIRGKNGVIIAEPSAHTKEDGRYRWLRTGPVPLLGPTVAGLLADAGDDHDAATDIEVRDFFQRFRAGTSLHLLQGVQRGFEAAITGGGSRHNAARDAACWALREAAAGLYPAEAAKNTVARIFRESINGERPVERELEGILSWAVAQARYADPIKVRTEVEGRDPLQLALPGTVPMPLHPTGTVPAFGAGPPVDAANITPVDGSLPTGTDGDGTSGGFAIFGVAVPERLVVNNPAILADWLRTQLGQGPLAGVFLRSGELVYTPRVGEEGYIPPEDRDDDGPAQVRIMDASRLASRCQYTYSCIRVTVDRKTGETKEAPGLFPVPAAKVPVDVPDMLPHVRTLRGVVHSPVLRPDGSLLEAPGFDLVTGLLHLPEPGFVVPLVPAQPSGNDVVTAVALLNEMLAGFIFASDDDRANYLGLLLTPVLRSMLPPPYKLGCIGAPMPGSGKSLLADILRIVHGGVFRAEVPGSEEEFRKQISSILEVTTGPVVQFDNVVGVLRSSTLAALLTSRDWDDRRLGSNQMVHASNDRLWTITGNNVSLGGDLVRRALWITIDPKVPDPHLRTNFAIVDLPGWVRRHRGELVHGLLTLARAWVAAGSPHSLDRSDSYARWTGSIRGLLQHAGIPGTFDSPATARQGVGVDDSDWGKFLARVYEIFGSTTWEANEIIARIGNGVTLSPHHPLTVDDLPEDLAAKFEQGRSITRSLGRWLMNHDGRFAGKYVVRRASEPDRRVTRWQVSYYE